MNCTIILQNFLKTKNIQKYSDYYGYYITSDKIYFNNSILFHLYSNKKYCKYDMFNNVVKTYKHNKLLKYINIKNNKIIFIPNIKYIYTWNKNKDIIGINRDFDMCKCYNSSFILYKKNYYSIFLLYSIIFNYYYFKNKYIVFIYKQYFYGAKLNKKYKYQYSNLYLII